MRRPMLLAMLVLVCCSLQAPPAHAAPGMNLRWDACSGDGGATNKNFACDTNAGTDVLVLSYQSPVPLDSLSGFELYLKFQQVSPLSAPPSWWATRGTGTCRNGALTMDFVAPAGMTNCVDPWAGVAAGGIGNYSSQLANSDGYRLDAAMAVPISAMTSLPAGVEMYLASIRIRHTKTVGTGACSGCEIPMCIGFGAVRVSNGVLGSGRIGQPTVGPNTVGWQGGTTTGMQVFTATGNVVGVYVDCAGATPTQNRTWGAIKTLYH